MLGDNSRCMDVDRDSEPAPVFSNRDMQPQPPTSLINAAMIRNNTPDNRFKTNPTNASASLTNRGGLTSSTRVQRLMSSPAHSERLNENRQPSQSNQAHSHHYHHSSTQSNSIGHYELKKTLGKGNFSTVKLAQHKITRHSVAIKIAKFSALSEENLMKLHREIDVLKKLGRHNHIVRLYQVIKTKRYFFLVTEYCASGELYEYLVAKGRLDEAQSCKYFRQILSAVEYLHDHNIVHRDLKAENLLLTDNCETVKIADFGFANYFKTDNPLSTWCGSPPYAAPELFNGLLYKGPPVDIWSMGVILYVLVCGSLPFDGPNLVHLKSRVTSGKFRIPFFMTDDCESLIRGMLRLDPERRFSIKQIKAHAWTQKNSKVQHKDSSKKRAGVSSRVEINNNGSPPRNMSENRGQSLDSDEEKMMQTSDLQQNADTSMSCLTNQTDTLNKMHKPNFETGSKISPSNIRNFVDTDIVNAVSNLSIDSNNSSISQGMDITNATFSNHSGCASSLSSSRYSGTPRADSACQTNHLRQFSKESSIDDQIIDFMVDNLKIADNHTSIRQSIANDKYDDLHAIYRLLKDQPEMVLETKFKIPSLPLISPNRDDGGKKPSITTGFFNFPQIQNNPASIRVETTRASFSGETINREPIRQSIIEDTSRTSMINPSSLDQRSENYPQELSTQEQAWKIPPQLFLTPPIEGRTLVTRAADESEAQDSAPIMRNTVARHSFDSALRNRPAESSPSHGLTRDSLWDSSMLDSQGASLTPTTPVKLGDSFISTDFAGEQGVGNEAAQLVQNLATITTNLPQIGSYINSPNVINHNLLLAQLNSAGCNSLMTQSGLLSQHDAGEQRLQQNIPLKFTPNNLVNQNYNVINNFTLQNTLKLPGVPNLSLLDPDSLVSGLERRASDGQASYSSLTTADQTVRGKQVNSDASQRPHVMTGDSSSANQILTLAMSGHSSPLATNTYQHNPPNFDDLFSRTQFGAQDSGESSNAIDNRNGDGCQVGNLIDVNGPLDLSNKLPSTALRSCDIESSTRDGLKRISNQRSNSTASETAVCLQNLPNSATTSPRILAPTVATSNNAIPFCHASKRAKKLH